jgi:hypothetical protein
MSAEPRLLLPASPRFVAAGTARLGYWLSGCQICKGFVSFAAPSPPLGRAGERAGYWLLRRIPVSLIGPGSRAGAPAAALELDRLGRP